jgi:hypothetical protein
MTPAQGEASPQQHTDIAGRKVPVAPGPRTVIHFSGACHPNDPPGPYDFWSVQNRQGKVITGRSPAGSDPGQRFRMTESQPGHEAFWTHVQTAVLVRPAAEEEVLSWLRSHPVEAPCAGKGQIGAREIRIVMIPGGSYAVQAAG